MKGEHIRISATEYQTNDGSVVHSGVAFADAVIDAINRYDRVLATLDGLKGTSSSYFNVFLRRIDEECGIQSFGNFVEMEFDSKVQQMMYDRSFQSLCRGVKRANQVVHSENMNNNKPRSTSLFSRILSWF